MSTKNRKYVNDNPTLIFKTEREVMLTAGCIDSYAYKPHSTEYSTYDVEIHTYERIDPYIIMKASSIDVYTQDMRISVIRPVRFKERVEHKVDGRTIFYSTIGSDDITID